MTLSDGEEPPRLAASVRYAGEDVRPTSSKELRGWYSYAFAAEVFVVCGVGSIIPITLEQLARENGVLLRDHSTPCATQDPTGRSSTNAALLARAPAEQKQCVITILGAEINTASFAMYTFSISVLLQALLIISMSGAADHGRFRKTLLLGFAAVGALATMLFVFVTPSVFVFGAFLAIVSNTCSGATFVLLNSFLPLLVRYHPDVQRSKLDTELVVSPRNSTSGHASLDRERDEDDLIDSTAALLADRPASGTSAATAQNSSSLPPISVALTVSSKLSANGLSIGYGAAIIVQLLAVVVVGLLRESLLSLRLVLFIIGLWWLLFSIPSALFLRPRPGPPLALPPSASAGRRSPWLVYLAHSWRKLFMTVRRASRLRDVLLFLCAWFLLSDAIATVSGTAVLFAKTTLDMPVAALAAINVIVMLSGVLGALSWARLSARLRLTPARTILACLAIFELIPLYALLAYLPPFKRWGRLGLQEPWEMYALGGVYGFVLGGLGSYCRAVFGELIPPGSEAAFYALYAITDKGSSVFGPVVVGAITDYCGEIRPAFGFLAVLIAVPIPILGAVDVARGRREGEALSRAGGGGEVVVGGDVGVTGRGEAGG